MTTIKLWKFNAITGYWDYQRTCNEDTAEEWLRLFRRDEPNESFKLTNRRPSGKPKREPPPAPEAILGYDNDGTPLHQGSIPVEDRPKVDEKWNTFLGEVTITGPVDPWGRGFQYVRDREQWQEGVVVTVQVKGQIGQGEVLDGTATRIAPAPTKEKS